jgi:hypothetical protein
MVAAFYVRRWTAGRVELNGTGRQAAQAWGDEHDAVEYRDMFVEVVYRDLSGRK